MKILWIEDEAPKKVHLFNSYLKYLHKETLDNTYTNAQIRDKLQEEANIYLVYRFQKYADILQKGFDSNGQKPSMAKKALADELDLYDLIFVDSNLYGSASSEPDYYQKIREIDPTLCKNKEGAFIISAAVDAIVAEKKDLFLGKVYFLSAYNSESTIKQSAMRIFGTESKYDAWEKKHYIESKNSNYLFSPKFIDKPSEIEDNEWFDIKNYLESTNYTEYSSNKSWYAEDSEEASNIKCVQHNGKWEIRFVSGKLKTSICLIEGTHFTIPQNDEESIPGKIKNIIESLPTDTEKKYADVLEVLDKFPDFFEYKSEFLNILGGQLDEANQSNNEHPVFIRHIVEGIMKKLGDCKPTSTAMFKRSYPAKDKNDLLVGKDADFIKNCLINILNYVSKTTEHKNIKGFDEIENIKYFKKGIVELLCGVIIWFGKQKLEFKNASDCWLVKTMARQNLWFRKITTNPQQPFWICEFPVTVGLYKSTLGLYNPEEKEEEWKPQVLTFDEAKVFCASLSDYIYEKTNKRKRYKFELPTEEQWYFALGDYTDFSKYEDSWNLHNSENSIHSVAGKRPNFFGLYDMLGNVYEWCINKQNNGIAVGGNYKSKPEELEKIIKNKPSAPFQNNENLSSKETQFAGLRLVMREVHK